MSGSPVSLRRRIGLAVASTCLALLAAEIGLRLFRVRPARALGAGLIRSGLFMPDPECGWVLAPSTSVRHQLPWGDTVRVTTNSAGLRDDELDPTDPRPRVIVLGDSFAFGWGVEDDQTLARRLGQRLPGFRFLNLGSSGTNTRQQRALLETRGFDLAPRAVVHVFCFNDVVEQSVPKPADRTLPAPDPGFKSWLSRNSALYELARTSVAGSKGLSRLFVSIGLKDSLGGYADLDHNVRPFLASPPPELELCWQSTLAEIRRIRSRCHARGVGYLLAVVPARQTVDADSLEATLAYVDYEPEDFDPRIGYRRMQSFGEAEGIPVVIPLATFLSAFAAGEEPYLPRDMHFSSAGIERFAAELEGPVEQLLSR